MARRYNRKYLVIFAFFVLMGLFMFATSAMASTPTASIVVTVNDDLKAPYPNDISSGIKVVDPTGQSLIKDIDFTLTEDHSIGIYTINGLTVKGDYLVSLGDGTGTETITVAGITPGAAAKTAKMVWYTYDGAKQGQAGVISGIVNDGVDALANVKVKVSNAKITWETTTDATGTFKVYLPSGSYKLIVYGTDAALYRNYSYNITVPAGQINSPLDPINGQSAINKLGLTLDAPATAITVDGVSGILGGIDETTKEINGNVNSDAVVSIYDISATTPVLITTAKPDKDGNFSVKFANALNGKKLQMKVVDSAENVYTLDMGSGVSLLDPALVKTDTEYASDITITFTDPNKLMTAATTKVAYDDGINGVKVLDSSKYTLTPGSKIVIKAGTLDVGIYTIKLINSAFDDNKSSVDNLLIDFSKDTSKSAPSLAVKATAASGGADNVGKTKLEVTPEAGNTIYTIAATVNSMIASPKWGVDTSAFSLNKLPDDGVVSGVDASVTKYLGVYEVTPRGALAKYTLLTITSSMVNPGNFKAPILSSVALSGANKIVTLTFDQTIYNGRTGDFKTAVKLSTVGTTFKALGTKDTVVVTQNTVVVTFDTALSGTNNKIQISAGALQNLYGVKNALVTTSGMDTRSLTAVLTGTVISSSNTETNIINGGKTIILTLIQGTWVDSDGTDVTNSNDYKSTTVNSLFNGIAANGLEGIQWAKVVAALKADVTGGDNDAVRRTSDTILTITLPAVATYDITADQVITVTIPQELVKEASSAVVASPTFTIAKLGPTAVLTGTVTSSSTATETNIVTGGNTIILTLSNGGTWLTADGANMKYKSTTIANLLSGMTANGSEGDQWAKVVAALKADITGADNNDVIRTSNTILTITLPAVATYDITAADQAITVVIPKALVSGATSTIVASPMFTIAKDEPTLAVTGTAAGITLATDIVAGGKTIVLTLTNGKWAAADGTNPNVSHKYKSTTIDSLLDGMTANGSEGSQWTKVITALKAATTLLDNNAVIRTSDTDLTITLPAVTGYNISSDQVITLRVPQAMVIGATAVVTGSPTIKVIAKIPDAAHGSTVSTATIPVSPTAKQNFTFTVTVKDATAGHAALRGLTSADFVLAAFDKGTQNAVAGTLTKVSVVESGTPGVYTVTANYDAAHTGMDIEVTVEGVKIIAEVTNVVVKAQIVDSANGSTVSATTIPTSPTVKQSFTFTVTVKDATAGHAAISGLTSADFVLAAFDTGTQNAATGTLTKVSVVESDTPGAYTVTANYDAAHAGMDIGVTVKGVKITDEVTNVVVKALVVDSGNGSTVTVTAPAIPTATQNFTFKVTVRDTTAAHATIRGLTSADFALAAFNTGTQTPVAGQLTKVSVVEVGTTGVYTVTANYDKAHAGMDIEVTVNGVKIAAEVTNVVVKAVPIDAANGSAVSATTIPASPIAAQNFTFKVTVKDATTGHAAVSGLAATDFTLAAYNTGTQTLAAGILTKVSVVEDGTSGVYTVTAKESRANAGMDIVVTVKGVKITAKVTNLVVQAQVIDAANGSAVSATTIPASPIATQNFKFTVTVKDATADHAAVSGLTAADFSLAAFNTGTQTPAAGQLTKVSVVEVGTSGVYTVTAKESVANAGMDIVVMVKGVQITAKVTNLVVQAQIVDPTNGSTVLTTTPDSPMHGEDFTFRVIVKDTSTAHAAISGLTEANFGLVAYNKGTLSLATGTLFIASVVESGTPGVYTITANESLAQPAGIDIEIKVNGVSLSNKVTNVVIQ